MIPISSFPLLWKLVLSLVHKCTHTSDIRTLRFPSISPSFTSTNHYLSLHSSLKYYFHHLEKLSKLLYITFIELKINPTIFIESNITNYGKLCKYVRFHKFQQIYIHKYTHKYIYTYIYKYIHTYTYTYVYKKLVAII